MNNRDTQDPGRTKRYLGWTVLVAIVVLLLAGLAVGRPGLEIFQTYVDRIWRALF